MIKIIIFSFRLNGLKSNYFCGDLSHVSVLLAILCLSHFTTSAIIRLLLLCATFHVEILEINMTQRAF